MVNKKKRKKSSFFRVTFHAFLELILENKHLKFNISNTVKRGSKPKEKGGVGLENILERLRLLFPERHQLDIRNENGIYAVHLEINLSNPYHEI